LKINNLFLPELPELPELYMGARRKNVRDGEKMYLSPHKVRNVRKVQQSEINSFFSDLTCRFRTDRTCGLFVERRMATDYKSDKTEEGME
jgi:hypothetical protein